MPWPFVDKLRETYEKSVIRVLDMPEADRTYAAPYREFLNNIDDRLARAFLIPAPTLGHFTPIDTYAALAINPDYDPETNRVIHRIQQRIADQECLRRLEASLFLRVKGRLRRRGQIEYLPNERPR